MKVGNKMKMNLTGAIEILKLHKHTTDKFKHSVGDQYVSDAIDTVVAEVEKDVIMEDKLMMVLKKLAELEGFVDVPNVEKTPTESLKAMVMLNLIVEIIGLVTELEKPLPTDEQIEAYALENILDGVGIQSMINTKAWIAGARWMRGLIQERRKK